MEVYGFMEMVCYVLVSMSPVVLGTGLLFKFFSR